MGEGFQSETNGTDHELPSENNLLEYAVLEEKAETATAHHNELSAQIKWLKSAWQRLLFCVLTS